MPTTNVDLWNQIRWKALDPTAQRLLLADRLNRGETMAAFCDRTGAPPRTVERIANTEGFEELQAILATLADREREARHLRSVCAALRNAPGAGRAPRLG